MTTQKLDDKDLQKVSGGDSTASSSQPRPEDNKLQDESEFCKIAGCNIDDKSMN